MGRFTNARRKAYRVLRDPGAGWADPLPLARAVTLRTAFFDVQAHHRHGDRPCACVAGHRADDGARQAGSMLAAIL